MLATHVFEYFAFGYNYLILRSQTRGKKVLRDSDSLETLLSEFFTHLDTLNLRVTAQAAFDLSDLREQISSMPEDAVVDADLANKVTQACTKLDVTLHSELGLRTAFVVTPGRFSIQHLLEEPSELLGRETLPRLPDIALFDFNAACRALAFGLATAAAFHLMRCLEAMLREYYTTLIKRNRIKELLWSPMIQHLRKKRRSMSPKALLDHMDNIRVNFRNPTQHPDARYELEEAQDLLSVSIDALNRMARDLAEREQGK